MTQAERSEDVASEPRIARGDDANGLSEAAKFMRKFVSKKMVAIQIPHSSTVQWRYNDSHIPPARSSRNQ